MSVKNKSTNLYSNSVFVHLPSFELTLFRNVQTPLYIQGQSFHRQSIGLHLQASTGIQDAAGLHFCVVPLNPDAWKILLQLPLPKRFRNMPIHFVHLLFQSLVFFQRILELLIFIYLNLRLQKHLSHQ